MGPTQFLVPATVAAAIVPAPAPPRFDAVIPQGGACLPINPISIPDIRGGATQACDKVGREVGSPCGMPSDPFVLSDTLGAFGDGFDFPPSVGAAFSEDPSPSSCSSTSDQNPALARHSEDESNFTADYGCSLPTSGNSINFVSSSLRQATSRQTQLSARNLGSITFSSPEIETSGLQNALLNLPSGASRLRTWDQILDVLYILPSDAHFAIRRTIAEALATLRAENGSGSPIVERCLYLAVSTHDPLQMRAIALRTLEKCRPQQIDPLDKLADYLALPATSGGTQSMSLQETSTTRPPIGFGVPAIRGDANFREAVSKKCDRPWFDLVNEIRTMKPNNGYPVRVNITAAIKSATCHQVHRSTEVARRLAYSLSLYCRKSCGATKQEALKVLNLMHDSSKMSTVLIEQ